MKFVVTHGNPIDGVSLTGPFDTTDAANAWADQHIATEYDWWIAPMAKPEENV